MEGVIYPYILIRIDCQNVENIKLGTTEDTSRITTIISVITIRMELGRVGKKFLLEGKICD